jgi:hypothetical protein
VWSWDSGANHREIGMFFFAERILELRVERFESLCTLNTSPPQNSFTFHFCEVVLKSRLSQAAVAVEEIAMIVVQA